MNNNLDASQLPVIQANKGFHLVLAPPGCGKTHILAERVRYAFSKGIAFEDMLCLTFTNRAAREMTSRIKNIFPNKDISTLQVGNVHHFCSKFLFEYKKVPSDSSIIDDEEAVSIIADYKNEDDQGIIGDYQRYRVYQQIIFFSHLVYQIKHKHPSEVFLHPECLSKEEIELIKYICKRQQIPYNDKAIIYIYDHAESFLDYINDLDLDRSLTYKIIVLLRKMYLASCYEHYKIENHLIDFEDLLLFTYDIYKNNKENKHYKWIQVDEVQDLNGMQLAIIDLLTEKNNSIVMFLGDEQQAIFSFMGAKADTLNLLKSRCKGNIHHLMQNHRSPKYLLDIFNTYAEKQLKIDKDLLPITDNKSVAETDSLKIISSNTIEDEIMDVIILAKNIFLKDPEATTAIIVNSNLDADKISCAMSKLDITHFKVSGKDLFDKPSMKLLLSHLEILSNEHNFIAWARLMKGVKALSSNSLSRRFNRKLKSLSISPVDLLEYEENTYLNDFLTNYQQQDIVVFDTETTGLDVFNDDIIEISAIKIRNGKQIGKTLDLYIYTDKTILPKLGIKDNPLYEIYNEKLNSGELINIKEALKVFLRFVDNSILMAHNINYDYHILDNCLRRYTGDNLNNYNFKYFDSLKIIRLLEPSLRSYKLEHLLDKFQLEGVNSHQAIDDVWATVNLINYCAKRVKPIVSQQLNFLKDKQVFRIINKLKAYYGSIYREAKQYLYTIDKIEEPAIITALTNAHVSFVTDKTIENIERLDYVLRYIKKDIIGKDIGNNSLAEQLSRFIMNISTMKESDFCNSKSIKEHIYVTTIHKAKGLEFDNVIVFDAANGRYPNAYNKTKKEYEEDSRKFYVALSRAKKRVIIAYALSQIDRYGNIHKREITPFMADIIKYFN
ncbi:3'-5' exonuclease [Prevotella amnii]|uniref:3'-5' exonuclease n=1 Tax=Prevotella amnii TaxID=419005 RepID=UPI00336AD9A4